MSDVYENRSHSSSSKTAVSGGSSNKEDFDEICDHVTEPFHRMSSQRRRRLWTLAARAGVKRGYSNMEFNQDQPMLSCHSETMGHQHPYLSQHEEGLPMRVYSNRYASLSVEKPSTSTTTIVVSTEGHQKFRKSPEIFDQMQSSSLLGVNVKDYVKRGRKSMKNQRSSTETSGLGSSLDWASTETLNTYSRSLQQRHLYRNRLNFKKREPLSDALTPGQSPTSFYGGSHESPNLDQAHFINEHEPQGNDYPYLGVHSPGNDPYNTFHHKKSMMHHRHKVYDDELSPVRNHLEDPSRVANLPDRFYAYSPSFPSSQNPQLFHRNKSSVSRPLILGQPSFQTPYSSAFDNHRLYEKIIRPQLTGSFDQRSSNQSSNYQSQHPSDIRYLQIPGRSDVTYNDRASEPYLNTFCGDYNFPQKHSDTGSNCKPHLSRRAVSLEKPDSSLQHELYHEDQPHYPSFNSPKLVDRGILDSNLSSIDDTSVHLYPKIFNKNHRFSHSDAMRPCSSFRQRQMPNRFAVSYDEEPKYSKHAEKPRLCQSADYVHLKQGSKYQTTPQKSTSQLSSKNRITFEENIIQNKLPEIEILPYDEMDHERSKKSDSVQKKKVSIISNEVKQSPETQTTKYDFNLNLEERDNSGQNYALVPQQGTDVGLSLKMSSVDLHKLSEYWDHAIFTRTRLWAVFFASFSSILLIYIIFSKHWIVSQDSTIYVSLWFDCSQTLNQTCHMTIPFVTQIGSWKAGTTCIIIIVFFCTILGIGLSITGHFVSSLPKQLYYFHSGGEIFFMSGILIGLAQVIFYSSKPAKIEKSLTKLVFGPGFYVCYPIIFLYILASILLLLDEIIHELTKLANKHPSLQRFIGCLFGCISVIHRSRKSFCYRLTNRSKKNPF